MSREEAMRRHPSYQSRIDWLISEARREQADDVARRMLVDADAFMGGVPESPEVRQERMDREACELASSNAAPAVTWRSQVVPVVGLIGAFTVVAWLPAVLSDLFGGWAL